MHLQPESPKEAKIETRDEPYIGFLQAWYMLSKTLAEEAAWKFAKEKGIDIVTINPGLVIGPLLQPTLNTSVEPILKLINGTLQQF